MVDRRHKRLLIGYLAQLVISFAQLLKSDSFPITVAQLKPNVFGTSKALVEVGRNHHVFVLGQGNPHRDSPVDYDVESVSLFAEPGDFILVTELLVLEAVTGLQDVSVFHLSVLEKLQGLQQAHQNPGVGWRTLAAFNFQYFASSFLHTLFNFSRLRS